MEVKVALGSALAALILSLAIVFITSVAATATPTCTKTWTGANSGNWTGSGNWSPSGAPSATDYVCIASGTNNPTIGSTTNVSIAGLELDGLTLTVNGTLTVTDTSGTKSSVITGGALGGSGTVSVAIGHIFTWTGGTMQGTGSTIVASGATLAMDASAEPSYLGLDTRTLTNNGTISYKPSAGGTGSASFYLGYNCSGNPTSVVNNGTFTYNGQNSNDAGIGSQCATNTFTNNGTLTKATGSGSASVAPTFNNAGAVSATAGSLLLTGGSGTGTGTFGATGGATISLGGGTFNLANGSKFTGGVSIDGAMITIANAATLTITGSNDLTGGSIDGSGTAKINGTLNWTGGTMQGAGSTVVGSLGTLAMDASAEPSYLGLDTRTLTNNGTISYKPSAGGTGSASFYLGYNCSGNPTTFVNNGTFTYNGQNSNDAGIGSQCNADNIIDNSGTFTRAAGTGPAAISPAFDNDGTVTAAAGTLSFMGGGGTGQSATGQFGTSGAGEISLDAGTYHLSTGASFSGEGAIGGATAFADGSVSVSNMAFTSGIVDGGGTLAVNGTMTWTGGTMQGTGSTVVGSLGTLAMDASAEPSYLGLDTRTLANNGTISYKPSAGGTGSASFYLGYNCSGNPTWVVNNGTFTYNGQNSNDAGIGSQCATNTITNNGTFTKATGSGSAGVAPDFDNNGTINGNAGTLVIAGAFPAYDSGTSTLTKGALAATANVQINAISANIVHSAGSITLNGSGANIRNSGGTNALSQFKDNQATASFTVTGGKSLTVKPLSNAGTAVIGTSSTLSMNSGPYTQSGGTTTVNGNLTSTGTGAAVNINAGTLQGSGTVTPTVTSSGTIRPGTSSGILSISGGYTQNSGGTLAIEIGGTTAGTGYDRLNATGVATLSGTLSLSTINGFTPSVGQTFTIMAYASHTGCFTTITGTPGPGTAYDVSCNGTNVVVTIKALPTITGYNPTAVKQKKPVTILGSAFTGATQVAFSQAGGGTVNAATFSVVDDGHITATVPSLATTGPVFVTTPAGTNSTAPVLKIKPSIKSFTPTSGPVGTTVTITGSAYTGATKVQFNGVNATFTVNSDTKITATVPVGATTGNISVTTAGGKAKSKTVFTVT